MNKIAKILLTTLLLLFLIILVIGIQSLIYWGIGIFICWAFHIPFHFTFIHGLAVAIIISVLKGIFNIKIEKE